MTKPLRITFLEPLPGDKPQGGYKVACEYANYLAKKGHSVSIVHPAIFRIDQPISTLSAKSAVRTVLNYVRRKLTGDYKPTRWFELLPTIKLLWVPSLAAKHIPEGDIVVATAWQTAEWALTYPSSKGNKFYLIQHLETWSGPEERVFATWKAPLEKIVIARWLQEIAEGFGQTAHLIHNGLDFKKFNMTTPPDQRDPYNLMMLSSSVEWKGTADGIAAFEIARKQEPRLKLTLFGVEPRPANLSSEIEYHSNPPQHLIKEIQNRSSIFISPSWTEGFPLPPAEALQCGTALAATDIPGTAMYAIHQKTALLSPPKDREALAANILLLVRDPELRQRLAHAGHEFIQQFTWQTAGAAFENVLQSSISAANAPSKTRS